MPGSEVCQQAAAIMPAPSVQQVGVDIMFACNLRGGDAGLERLFDYLPFVGLGETTAGGFEGRGRYRG